MAEDRTAAYAEAFLAVARVEGLSDLEDELFRLGQVVRGSDELREKLADPHLPAAIRQQIVEDLLQGRASPATIGLVSLAVATGRARQLPAIIDEMVALAAREADKEVAEVRSAIELTDDQKSRLADALGKATGKRVDVKVIIDPSIQGGIVAQVGDTVIDGSVRRRLDQLKNTL
jgi:F-type H+-transporting ATPase subunit delta